MQTCGATYRITPEQILMMEVMEVLRSGSLSVGEIIPRLPLQATLEGVKIALGRAKQVGAVIEHDEKWKLAR